MVTKLRKRRKISKELDLKITELYFNNKLNPRQIGEILNVSGNSIRRIIKFSNLPLRKTTLMYFCNENYFENIDSKDKAYFLGLLVADGYNNNKQIELCLQEEDGYILELFKKYVKFTGNINFYKRKQKNCKNICKVTIRSEKLCKDLTELGCAYKKAHFTYFPNIPEEYWSHFIRGVFDGDGCIYLAKNNQKSFNITGNDILLHKIQEILIKECQLTIKTKMARRFSSFSLIYGGNTQIKRIYDYIYKDCEDLFLKRKKEKFEK